jgi:hypothetical protein
VVRVLNLTALALLVVGPAQADPTSPYESMRSKLLVLEDGKQHYLAYMRVPDLLKSTWFYGDGKTFHQLVVSSTRPNVNVARATWMFDDPRYRNSPALMLTDFDAGEFVVTCGKRKTSLKPVAASDAAKLVANAALEEPVRPRYVTYFGRDTEDTTYYLVDRPWTPTEVPDSRDYRLFIGKRGAMHQVAIKDQAVDSAGVLVITTLGKLRYTQKTQTLEWLPAAGKPREIAQIASGADSDLLYNQLGVYTGVRFGTPCDDL